MFIMGSEFGVIEQCANITLQLFTHELRHLELRLKDSVLPSNFALAVDKHDAQIVLIQVQWIESFFGWNGLGRGQLQSMIHEGPECFLVACEKPPVIGWHDTHPLCV